MGFVCLLPIAIGLRVRWPGRRDWPAVAGLGVCFFGLFFVLYNIAVGYTTAARASLALSTLPLQTMVVGALLGVEPMTVRKTVGVAIAMAGVGAALASGLADAPQGAWRGELIMTGAVLCMAFYNVWSRPFIQRSSALGFLAIGMGAGAAVLLVVGTATGRLAVLGSLGPAEWAAGLYLGIGGRCLGFHPLGPGPPAGEPDAGRRDDDRQPGRSGAPGDRAGRRADHAQPDRRADRRVRRHLDRDHGAAAGGARAVPGPGH